MRNRILKKWKDYDNIEQISSSLNVSRYLVKKILEDENVDYLKFFGEKAAKVNEERMRVLKRYKDAFVGRLSQYKGSSVFVYDDLFYYFSTNKQEENGNWLVKDDFVRVVKSRYKGYIINPIPVRSFDRLTRGADTDWTNVDHYINMLGKKVSLRKLKDEDGFFSVRTKFEARIINWEQGVEEIWEKTKRLASM